MRTNCSNPPTHGGTVVSTVLNTPELYTLWTTELAAMRERIRTMRVQLVEKLKAHGVTQNFDFMLAQRGMFSYSGLTKDQEIGRASCRERVWQDVKISVVAVALKKKSIHRKRTNDIYINTQ